MWGSYLRGRIDLRKVIMWVKRDTKILMIVVDHVSIGRVIAVLVTVSTGVPEADRLEPPGRGTSPLTSVLVVSGDVWHYSGGILTRWRAGVKGKSVFIVGAPGKAQAARALIAGRSPFEGWRGAARGSRLRHEPISAGGRAGVLADTGGEQCPAGNEATTQAAAMWFFRCFSMLLAFTGWWVGIGAVSVTSFVFTS